MRIGVPREIINHEYRVGMTPAGVNVLVEDGHEVVIESSAGMGSGLTDQEYTMAGATVVAGPEEVYARGELIVKVKEPRPEEYGFIREGQLLFTYFHFAANRELTEAMIASKAVCIAYETVQTASGSLPTYRCSEAWRSAKTP